MHQALAGLGAALEPLDSRKVTEHNLFIAILATEDCAMQSNSSSIINPNIINIYHIFTNTATTVTTTNTNHLI